MIASGKRRAESRQEESSRKRKDGAPTSITMELDVLDCPVCFEPLRPPIFQCAVGHLIRSSCCGKLPKPQKCHYCSCKSGYKRNHGIEKIIESIQVPCSNTKYGCSMKTSYYLGGDHETTCPHAPCFCPDIGCSFSGSTGMLPEHLIDERQWTSTKFVYGQSFDANIQEGVCVLSGEDEQLFLLNIVSEPFGFVISVFCVWPHDTSPQFHCEMFIRYTKNNCLHYMFSGFLAEHDTL